MLSLERHDRIALDLDGTLIDGQTSPLIQDFVRSNPEKKFWIVTFRTPAQVHTVASELANVGLPIGDFQRVIPMPERYVMEFEEDQRQRRFARLPGLDTPGVTPFPGEFRYLHWKGYVCKRIGATVLVDDLPRLSQMGCQQFGIELVDARNMTLAKAAVPA